MTTAVLSKWGNSHALRIPVNMVKELGIEANDTVYLENDEEKIIISKAPVPKKGTLEYLFKDYSGESFRTVLVNPRKPRGNEKW